ncbi:hypothetical protein HZA55_00635, partial [Candidatus Poribacteria bacterium]|nr:hypothetical protein [Candidatus Poribacteria bacterium]
MCKKLLLYFSLFNILFFSTIYAEIIKYDSSILFIKNEKNWVSPFHFIKTACISKISDNEIILDLGADHGVQTGLIYNIYHDLHKKPEAQICIISADKRTSIGYFLLKPKVIENIIPGDMAIFTGLIETKENLSYQNRMEKILSGKINLIEKDLTFINLKKPDGIETGQTFNVFNEKNDNIGEIEIIEPSNSGDSIAIIKTQKSPFNFGFNIKKGQRTAIEWSNIAHSLTTDKNNPDDIVYAYIKAIKMGINPADISIEVETTISPIAKKFESESNFGKSAYYYNLCKSFNKHCDDNYKFIIEKAMEQSKFFWKNKDWLEVIKILENLPKNEDTEKYLSGSYNFLGKECEEKNHSMAIYCYEQAFKISPTNIFAIKNMINLYFQDIIFDEAISWIKKFKQAALRDDDKNWAEIRCPESPACRQ